MPAIVAFVRSFIVISRCWLRRVTDRTGRGRNWFHKVTLQTVTRSPTGSADRTYLGHAMPSIARYCRVALTLPAIACRASQAAPAWLDARAHQEEQLAA